MIGHNPIGTNEWAKPQVLFWRLVVIGMFRLKTEVKGTSLHSGATMAVDIGHTLYQRQLHQRPPS